MNIYLKRFLANHFMQNFSSFEQFRSQIVLVKIYNREMYKINSKLFIIRCHQLLIHPSEPEVSICLNIENPSDSSIFQRVNVLNSLRIWTKPNISLTDFVKYKIPHKICIGFFNKGIYNEDVIIIILRR